MKVQDKISLKTNTNKMKTIKVVAKNNQNNLQVITKINQMRKLMKKLGKKATVNQKLFTRTINNYKRNKSISK